MKEYEHEWEELDLLKCRIPCALWWLGFKPLFRAKRYRQAFEAYPEAIFDITDRATPDQRPAAILRHTNQMLFLVAQYVRPCTYSSLPAQSSREKHRIQCGNLQVAHQTLYQVESVVVGYKTASGLSKPWRHWCQPWKGDYDAFRKSHTS